MKRKDFAECVLFRASYFLLSVDLGLTYEFGAYDSSWPFSNKYS